MRRWPDGGAVVDQDVDAAKLFGRLIDHDFDGLVLAGLGGEGTDGCPGRSQQSRVRLLRVPGARAQR